MLSDLVPSSPQEIAPSVRALLAAFHEETRQKLQLAPTDGAPIYERMSDGSLCWVGEDGWISDSDAELDKAEVITIQPTSVRDIEEPCDETLTQDGQRRPYGGSGVGNDEQLGLDFEVEMTEWGKWVDPDRRKEQAQKLLDHAGLRAIPPRPWPADSPDVKRLDALLAELVPDMATAMSPENADIADALICFLGECYIKFARAQWFDHEWRGRDHSFYDHVNPALRWFVDGAEEVVTAWGLMESVAFHSEFGDGFSLLADEMREEYARFAADVT